jgi:hypothetical protein
MVPDEYGDILNDLYAKTARGQVEWTATINNREFLVYFAKFALSVRAAYEDESRLELVSFTLKNEEGKNIDHFSVFEGETWFPNAMELHDAARRKANRVNEALKSITEELRTATTIGKRPPPDDEEAIPF